MDGDLDGRWLLNVSLDLPGYLLEPIGLAA